MNCAPFLHYVQVDLVIVIHQIVVNVRLVPPDFFITGQLV